MSILKSKKKFQKSSHLHDVEVVSVHVEGVMRADDHLSIPHSHVVQGQLDHVTRMQLQVVETGAGWVAGRGVQGTRLGVASDGHLVQVVHVEEGRRLGVRHHVTIHMRVFPTVSVDEEFLELLVGCETFL